MTPRFDAYTATLEGLKPDQAIPLFTIYHGRTLHQGHGYHTFKERLAIRDDSGSEVGSISWGGQQGARVMLEAKGEWTPTFVDGLRGLGVPYRCTRADSCVDFERPGVFEELLGQVLEVKQEHRLKGERRGDWDFPEDGRTQYLGAPSIPIRARLYEKGKQPDLRHLERFDLTRLEIQVRPQKEAKSAYAALSATDVWGASKWTRDLSERVLLQQLEAHPPGTVRRDTKRDQALRWMVRQYAPHLVSLSADLGGWDVVGLTLGEMVREERERAARRRREGGS